MHLFFFLSFSTLFILSSFLSSAPEDRPVPQNLENWVNTPEFDAACDRKAKERALASSDEARGDLPEDERTLLSSPNSNDTGNTTATHADSDSHEVSEFEAQYYYYGLAPNGSHPRLIARDSADRFEEPTGPDTVVRQMRLVDVSGHHEFAKNGIWEQVRDWVRDLLHTTVFFQG